MVSAAVGGIMALSMTDKSVVGGRSDLWKVDGGWEGAVNTSISIYHLPSSILSCKLVCN